MGKQRTSKSTYPSLYSPEGYVTAAQYIIELICEKKAKTEKKDLPIRFWRLDEWSKFYKSQLRKTHSLLKKYDEKAIIGGLRDKKAWNIYSLFAPWLEDIIKEHQVQLDRKNKAKELAKADVQPEVPEDDIIYKKPRQHRVDGNIQKILDLD
jgi:hypothetical protein